MPGQQRSAGPPGQRWAPGSSSSSGGQGPRRGPPPGTYNNNNNNPRSSSSYGGGNGGGSYNSVNRGPRSTGGGRGGPTMSGGGSVLKLVNPLRISRLVEQTPGTDEELYSERQPQRRNGNGSGNEGGDRSPPQRGGRGAPRPVASTVGGVSKSCTEFCDCRLFGYRKSFLVNPIWIPFYLLVFVP